MTAASLPIHAFLNEDRLEVADIVLFRRKGSFFSRNLTRLTGDYFSHAGLVFATPGSDPGFKNAFVIECTFSGVDITPFDHFLTKRSAYVICIKRFERDWLDQQCRRTIRGHALNYIKAEYSFRTLTDLFLRTEAHLMFPRRRDSRRRARAIEYAIDRNMKLPTAFICSGFVQYAFFEGVKRALETRQPDLSKHALGECYFADARHTGNLAADLLSVSPQDLADSDRLNWKYLLYQGEAFPVDAQDDAMNLVRDLDTAPLGDAAARLGWRRPKLAPALFRRHRQPARAATMICSPRSPHGIDDV